VSEAARRPHTDGDDGKLLPITDILTNIRRQVEGGIPATMATGERTVIKIDRAGNLKRKRAAP